MAGRPAIQEHSLQSVIAHAGDSNRAKVGMQAANFKKAAARSQAAQSGAAVAAESLQEDSNPAETTAAIFTVRPAPFALSLGDLESSEVDDALPPSSQAELEQHRSFYRNVFCSPSHMKVDGAARNPDVDHTNESGACVSLGKQSVACLLETGQVMPMQKALASATAHVVGKVLENPHFIIPKGWVRNWSMSHCGCTVMRS